ncbi:MAG: AAA family ATPase [Bacteroidales bacterium]|nr:AAA family ATPase [Bacteroidales bacterium]
MLKRKIQSKIEAYLRSEDNKMLVVDGARQVGKSYIVRTVGQSLFPNYVEINMEKDKQNDKLFANARTVEDFIMVLSTIAGNKLKEKKNTLIFIDEIQAYDHLLTLVKFLMEDGRYTYIASGSQLGIALKSTQSLPLGSMEILHMYPLDFEEFLMANNVGDIAISGIRNSYENQEALSAEMHNKIMDLWRKYLLVGGMPDAVNTFLREHNMVSVRRVQHEISILYRQDAAKHEEQSSKKLKIQRIYDMIPSNLENKKKRLVVKDIEDKKGKRMGDYQDEFDYIISAGIALEVNAVSSPTYPLAENVGKNLLKLYLNDVGIFTGVLYRNNIMPIMNDERSINLGSVYENVVAQELKAHDFKLTYYDNKKNGEVDYIVDDADNLTILPIEVKSGKDYKVHSALDHFLGMTGYNVKRAIVLSNEREVVFEGKILYMPIYYISFLQPSKFDSAEYIEI